jgi:hypothetical protein
MSDADDLDRLRRIAVDRDLIVRLGLDRQGSRTGRDGFRKRDVVVEANNVRVHLLSEGGGAVCGTKIPLVLTDCQDCSALLRGDAFAEKLSGLLAARKIEPMRVLRVGHMQVSLGVHHHDARGFPLCGGRPIHLAPCSFCLAIVTVHIRAPWIPSHDGEPGIGICSPRELSADRLITASEAVSWVEEDHHELWRLCFSCEASLGRHLAKRERLGNKAEGAQTRRVVSEMDRRELALAQRQVQTNDKILTPSGRPSRSHSAFLADPAAERFKGPGIDLETARIAREDEARARERRSQVTPGLPPVPEGDE